MTAPWGAGALHQRLNAFVKKSLIQQLVPPNAVVCDLYCGRGVDTENWGEAKIGKYVGVDLSSSALEEAREEWERNEKPFVARFCELNPCMADLEKHLGVDRLSVDVVTCLSHLQDCFASEDMVRQLLKNVASLLKPGGYFFGATPDSSTIWYKYQKAVEGAMKAGSLRANGHLPRVRTELYSISFEDDRFNEYGSRYQLRFADESVPPQSQILVHFPSLIRRAEELGLECVEIQNLTEFYEDYRVPFAESLQKSCGTLVDAKGHPVVDGKSRLSPVAQDVLSLYTTFIFKKPDPQQRERVLKRPPVDAKKSKKISPAVHIPAPEDRPLKKQRLSASPAVVTSNGSKMQEPNPKQEKISTVKTAPKPDPVSTARSTLKPSKPSAEPKLEEKARTSVERMQKIESPSVSKAKVGAQRTESPSANKPKPLEQGQRGDSKPSEEVKVEGSQPSKITVQGTDTTNKPLVSESKAPEPVKRKRVSRWSSEYVPKAISAQNPMIKDEGITSQHPDQVVARFGSSQATPASDGKYYHKQGNYQSRRSPVPKQEPPEEGEVGADDPIQSPKREGHGPHNAAQIGTSSETVPGRNTGSESHFNGAVAPAAIHEKPDPQSERVRGEGLASDAQKNGSDVKKENPKPRKKEIAMDVLLDRQSTDTATTCTELASDPTDMDFERASKLSRDSPAAAGEEPPSDRFGSWETKPQRYTLRRAASLSEGGVESPWSRGGGGGGGGGRAPYFRGAAPGLLGAAPSPAFADRGEGRRFEGFARPNLRGNFHKNERLGAPGDGGNGVPWEEQFQGDARSRVNR